MQHRIMKCHERSETQTLFKTNLAMILPSMMDGRASLDLTASLSWVHFSTLDMGPFFQVALFALVMQCSKTDHIIAEVRKHLGQCDVKCPEHGLLRGVNHIVPMRLCAAQAEKEGTPGATETHGFLFGSNFLPLKLLQFWDLVLEAFEDSEDANGASFTFLQCVVHSVREGSSLSLGRVSIRDGADFSKIMAHKGQLCAAICLQHAH